MDPLSITASVLGISTVALKITKSLSDLLSRYRYASLTITAICSETAIINAALSQIQSLLFRDGNSIVDKFQERKELCSTFDVAVTGCQLLFSCLEEEVGKLMGAVNAGVALGRKDKMKAAWKEDVMTTILAQLRGQTAALNLLLQGLQMESVSEIRKLMRRHGKVLSKIEETTRSLRRAYPQNHVPDSIIDSCRSSESIFGTQTSTIGDAEFTFDDMVINSKVYRRTLTLAQLRVSTRPGPTIREFQAPEPEKAVDSSSSTNPLVPHLAPSLGQDRSFKWHAPIEFHTSTILNSEIGQAFPKKWEDTFNVSEEDLLERAGPSVKFAKNYWSLFRQLWCQLFAMRIFMSKLGSAVLELEAEGKYAEAATVISLYRDIPALQHTVQVLLYEKLLQCWQEQGAWTPLDIQLFTDYLDRTHLLLTSYVRDLRSRSEAVQKIANEELLIRAWKIISQYTDEGTILASHTLQLPLAHFGIIVEVLGTVTKEYLERTTRTGTMAELYRVQERYKKWYDQIGDALDM